MYNISLIGIVTMNLPLYNEYILRKFYKIIIIIVRDLVGVTVIAGKEHRTQPGEKHHSAYQRMDYWNRELKQEWLIPASDRGSTATDPRNSS
jgi:hypothetical protein